MQDRKSEIAKWQSTLEKTFGGVRGNVGTRIQSLYQQENLNRRLTKDKCQGFMTLMQSFFEFALRTMEEVQTHSTVLNIYNIALNVATLRRMRASLLVFEHGYHFDAASLLRTVFENTMYLAAVLRGLCWFDKRYEFTRTVDLSKIRRDQLFKLKHAHEVKLSQAVACQMYGKDSALEVSEQKEIRNFLKMQHMHVHNAESTVIYFAVEMAQDGSMPRIAPEYDHERASIYANTAVCAAWSHHRVLKYLSEPAMNSSTWHEQWAILDDAFRVYIVMWDSGPASAIIRLMDTSFTFDDNVAVRQLCKTQPMTKQ